MLQIQMYAWDTVNNKLVEVRRDEHGGLVCIPHVHHKVHKKESYEWSNRWTGLATGSRDYLVVCGAVEFHIFIARIIHNNTIDVLVYRNPTVSANGTAITGGNRYLGTDLTTTTKIYVTPTVTSVGTLRNEESSFADKKVSSGLSDIEERVLVPNQKMLVRITRVAGSVDGSIRFVGYED